MAGSMFGGGRERAGMVGAVVVLAVALGLLPALTEAAVYKVGDAAGWTTIGNVNYKQWAALKNFQVGDVIIFQYNPQFHNVMQVTHAEYKACNTTSPKATYTTGNDSITITTRGHHHFFCGVPGHCQVGQKVDINVPRIRASSAGPMGAPAPSSGATDSSTVPASGVPGPSPNSGSALISAFGAGSCYNLGMTIVLVLAFYSSIFV
ncbi:chemocyanin-like [Punica granatum]|uniref:Chemocyanin-like n=1 Tax=Punica granatum TaxID=22663 RepID=A0A218WP34_PUNGR|nr:chemocyanin-like [Punica granatum]OWM74239.1 hypothetical protein CDL15_Pgr008553 [Punica granatum]